MVLIALTAAASASATGLKEPVEVRVRDTPSGPRIFVDGKAVKPRFFFGSPANLSIIAWTARREFTVPFRAEEDTSEGCIEITVSGEDDPVWFSGAGLFDVTEGTRMELAPPGETRTRKYVFSGLSFRKGHDYRFRSFHRASRERVYLMQRVSYRDAAGKNVVLPLPYGDTLADTVRLAADAGVDFVTFSTDNSWGCTNWWAPPGSPPSYGRLEKACESVIAANPRALLIPRISANAPEWMLKRDPSIKMKFDKGYTIEMSSVSARSYRRAACAEVERLARHLRRRFPRNFAGLHVSGQNSAEWFYMLSQSRDLSGYDVHTRDAFRQWLAARGAPDAATAEVPSPAQRRVRRPLFRFDPVLDRRVLDFCRFRQEEMAGFLDELGGAVRRGTDGKSLSLFFYGYSWEVGGVHAGAGETGHFFMDWLLKKGRGNIDGISAPMSYAERGWPGSSAVMSAAETVIRNGILWINEDDTRTHHELLWDFPVNIAGFRNESPWMTRNFLLRNAATCILRGHGDWWMDLCGRGWFRDKALWDIRRSLNAMDDDMMKRRRRYTPEIALVVDEESLMGNGWGSSPSVSPFLDRTGFERCGAPYGQYLLDDVLESPTGAKLYFIAYARGLSPAKRAKVDALGAMKGVTVFEAAKPSDLSAPAIAALAKKAGVRLYAPAGRAIVCAAEGYVSVQAQKEGPLELDFGGAPVRDVLTGGVVSEKRRAVIPFRKGETRIFKVGG